MRHWDGRGKESSRILAAVAIGIALLFHNAPSTSAATPTPEIWLSPTEHLGTGGGDFPDFFLHPDAWRQAAKAISRFSVTVRYLLNTPADVVARDMRVLHDLGVHLDVAVPALPVDKHVCGDGIEGTVWPGEPGSYSAKLKARNIDVYSFSLDLPLTSGHLDRNKKACHLSIEETAERTARATSDILKVYPDAKIVDVEVPTGMPPDRWFSILQKWVDAYRHASGRNFDGFMMDAWWQFDWRSAARETAKVLVPQNIPIGIGINASGLDSASPSRWIAAARENYCQVMAAKIHLDYLGVANWQNMQVRGLPDSDDATLTGLVRWMESHRNC